MGWVPKPGANMALVPVQPVPTGPNRNADFGASFQCQIVCGRGRERVCVCDGDAGDWSKAVNVAVQCV